MPLWPMLLCVLAILATVGPMPTHGAVANSHKHEKHTSKERVKDGIYAPRDAHHHGEHGEHNVEFDHEAIIGRYAQPNLVESRVVFSINVISTL